MTFSETKVSLYFFIRILPSYLQIEKHIADKITSLREKRDISKYRLSQLPGISLSSRGRVMEQETVMSMLRGLRK